MTGVGTECLVGQDCKAIGSLNINSLSDDTLVHILSLFDSAQLRSLSETCKRWNNLLKSRGELWEDVQITLLPKIRKGRDRSIAI